MTILADLVDQSGADAVHNFAVDIGQAILPALITKGQPRVIDAAQMQQRGLHVVNMHRILGYVPSKVVGSSVRCTCLHTTASHPPAECSAEMIATFGCRRIALTERRATELTPQITKVSSSKPRSFRSFTRAADGPSVSRH